MLLTSVIILLASCSAVNGKLRASIQMNGVSAVIEFEQANPSVVEGKRVNERGLASSGITVKIRSRWMGYDEADKCSDATLGRVEISASGTWNPTTTFSLSTTLKKIQGRSIVLEVGGQKFCGSIEDDEINYRTAFADFGGVIAGTVYFRQPESRVSDTLVACQLVTDKVFKNMKWKITDGIKSCDDKGSYASASPILPEGDLSVKLGPPQTQSNSITYSGSNLLLNDDPRGIVNKFLIIYEDGDYSKSSCAKIHNFHSQKATSRFSQKGIDGHISFNQRSPFDKTEVSVDLQGLDSKVKNYHIHVYPVPVQTEKGQPLCTNQVVAGHFNPYGISSFPPDGTDDQYEIGDLSSRFGNLKDLNQLSKNYTDWNLPMFGKHSIVGRSLVIHKNDAGNSRYVCSNINLDDSVVSAVAVFKYPVYGQVYFVQAQDMSSKDTWIYSHLNHLDDSVTPSVAGYKWHINMNKSMDDLASDSSRCAGNKDVFDPLGGKMCTNKDKAATCKLGDMSGKHGKLLIAKYPGSQAYYTDSRLTLAGGNSIIGKSVVIMDSAGSNVLACATIELLHKPMLKADLSLGTVSFAQEPGFGMRPTAVKLDLSGFSSKDHKLQIRALPSTDGNSKCSDLGEVYNPLDVTETDQSKTRDEFKLGNLATGKSEWKDLNLPLTGLTSIRHRSLVVVDMKGNVITCGIIQDPYSRSFDGYQVVARATFGNPLEGNIDLFQTLYKDGTMTDTSVVVSLNNKDGAKTPNHNWHVHVELVSGDADATPGRCSSTGPHYDPYMAKVGGAATKYTTECSKTNPLRCELGDQAMKLGTYSLGNGKKVFTDIDLPLDGKYKAQGRSIVVHIKDKGAARYACADIYPVSNLYLNIEFDTPPKVDLREAARLYGKIIHIDEDEMVVQVMSTTDKVTKARVYFLGNNREIMKAKFKAYFEKEDNRKYFGKYAPLSTPEGPADGNKAGGLVVSSVLLLVTLVLNAAVFHI